MGALNATILQKLEGQIRPLAGAEFRFVESDNGKPATWGGGEGFAVPVDVRNGGRHILKIFKLPTPERARRARFLSTLSLGSLHSLRLPLFAAAPTWAVQGTLDVPGEGTFPVNGHIARFVHGCSFQELLMKGWDPPVDVRTRLARQLCFAIELLEGGAEFVHGDLSPANLMIVDAESASPKLCLIDFDGFHHPGVPAVPVSRDRGGRSWGTPGYRAPSFRKGTDSLVDSDRVALAILVLEMVALRPADIDALPGETLLEQADIDARAPSIPEQIADRWPEGWDLLQTAITAAVATGAPAPIAWRRALDRLDRRSRAPISAPAVAAPAPPFVVFVRPWGREDRQVRLHRPSGTFQQVSPELAWLGYTLEGDRLDLAGQLPPRPGFTRGEPLLVRHGGPHADWTRYDGGAVNVTACLGDVLHWGDSDIYLG